MITTPNLVKLKVGDEASFIVTMFDANVQVKLFVPERSLQNVLDVSYNFEGIVTINELAESRSDV